LKTAVRLVLVVIALLSSISCGVDSYTYLSPVAVITATFNSNAEIRLPNAPDIITIDFTTGKPPSISVVNQSKTYGEDYEIFYRIYLSDKLEQTINTDTTRKIVNSALDSDWTALEPYTVDSNNLSSSVLTAFTNRKYYSVLKDSSGNLLRSNGNGKFNPAPSDRFFMTSDDLTNRANITDNINADVQDNTTMSDGAQRYVYASMYIVMRSFDQLTLTPIYSAPAFINVFLLPANVPVVYVTGVSLSPSTATANPAIKLTATVTPSNATDIGVTWSLDKQGIADIQVLSNNTAIISSVAGSGLVRVTVKTNDGSFTDYSDVTLSGFAAQNITITPPTLSLSVGGNTNLNVSITPSSALQSVTWASSNTSVATVNSSGSVTAVGLGTAVITATTIDGTERTATCGVTVVQ
jgi:uncharacterized protein YjdB